MAGADGIDKSSGTQSAAARIPDEREAAARDRTAGEGFSRAQRDAAGRPANLPSDSVAAEAWDRREAGALVQSDEGMGPFGFLGTVLGGYYGDLYRHGRDAAVGAFASGGVGAVLRGGFEDLTGVAVEEPEFTWGGLVGLMARDGLLTYLWPPSAIPILFAEGADGAGKVAVGEASGDAALVMEGKLQIGGAVFGAAIGGGAAVYGARSTLGAGVDDGIRAFGDDLVRAGWRAPAAAASDDAARAAGVAAKTAGASGVFGRGSETLKVHELEAAADRMRLLATQAMESGREASQAMQSRVAIPTEGLADLAILLDGLRRSTNPKIDAALETVELTRGDLEAISQRLLLLAGDGSGPSDVHTLAAFDRADDLLNASRFVGELAHAGRDVSGVIELDSLAGGAGKGGAGTVGRPTVATPTAHAPPQASPSSPGEHARRLVAQVSKAARGTVEIPAKQVDDITAVLGEMAERMDEEASGVTREWLDRLSRAPHGPVEMPLDDAKSLALLLATAEGLI